MLVHIVGHLPELRVAVLPQLQDGDLPLRPVGGRELVPQGPPPLRAVGPLQGGEVEGDGEGHAAALPVGEVGHHPVLIVPPPGEPGQPVEHPPVAGVEDVGAVLVDEHPGAVQPVIGVAAHVGAALQHQRPLPPVRQGPGGHRAGVARAGDQHIKLLLQGLSPHPPECPAVVVAPVYHTFGKISNFIFYSPVQNFSGCSRSPAGAGAFSPFSPAPPLFP